MLRPPWLLLTNTSSLPLFLTCAKRGSLTPVLQIRTKDNPDQTYHLRMECILCIEWNIRLLLPVLNIDFKFQLTV